MDHDNNRSEGGEAEHPNDDRGEWKILCIHTINGDVIMNAADATPSAMGASAKSSDLRTIHYHNPSIHKYVNDCKEE
jgi:hypothetical protein